MLRRLEEPAAEACVGLVYRLLTDEGRRGTATTGELGKWELRRSLLLADYARRSASLAAATRSQLDPYIVESFSATYKPGTWAGLGRVLQNTEACDVAVVTILREELEAAIVALDADKRARRIGDQLYYRSSIICANRPDKALSVIIGRMAEPLNVNAASSVTQVRDLYNPGAMFLMGIAAGLRDRFEIGDVVVPRKVFYYESDKITDEGIMPRPQYAEPDDPYLFGFGTYSFDASDYYGKVDTFMASVPAYKRPISFARGFRPSLVSENATIATGERVLRDGEYLAELRDRFDDTICAADQESYGFAKAARGLPWLIFRGISDHADTRRFDDWKYTAAGMAALCLRDFLEHSYLPPDLADL
jgi:nucleoside phosphorylase